MTPAVLPLRSRAGFAALRRDGRRVRRGTVTVTAVAAVPGEPVQVAYAISRRAGGAVVRNRIRRRLRAVVRELTRAAELAPGQYLVSAGTAASTQPYTELRATLAEAAAGATAGPTAP